MYKIFSSKKPEMHNTNTDKLPMQSLSRCLEHCKGFLALILGLFKKSPCVMSESFVTLFVFDKLHKRCCEVKTRPGKEKGKDKSLQFANMCIFYVNQSQEHQWMNPTLWCVSLSCCLDTSQREVLQHNHYSSTVRST